MQTAHQIQSWFESRAAARALFMQRYGWAGAALSPVGEDCAFRRYFRLARARETVILMEGVPDGSEIATPGHNIHDFVRISAHLREIGLKTPEVYESDETEGYLLIEDFGDISFKKVLQGGAGRDEIYGLATDVLLHMQSRADARALALPDYYSSHVHKGRRRVVDWYMPCVRLVRNPDGLAEDYLAVWDEIEASLPTCPQGFLHIDYHFENLMWLAHNEGTNRCGILDFQGAMTGPQPYDLANLLEDARVDVPQDLRRAMLDHYCRAMGAEDKELFRAWYRVLATQFHCRVIGQFIRLALRDGKERYLAHLPRVAGYLREGLQDPVLRPLKDWFKAQKIDFTEMLDLEAPQIVTSIREDAF